MLDQVNSKEDMKRYGITSGIYTRRENGGHEIRGIELKTALIEAGLRWFNALNRVPLDGRRPCVHFILSIPL